MEARGAHLGLLAMGDNKERGRRIAERRERLGMHKNDLAERAGVDRVTVARAERGEASVRATTFGALEAALDQVEEVTRPVHTLSTTPHIEQMEFTVEGDFGVKVTVKGPITDRSALEASVTNIIRSIRESSPPESTT